MNAKDQIKQALAAAPRNKRIDLGGVSVMPILTENGCKRCVFDHGQQANGCEYKEACMAHFRPDRKPVVFANPSTTK